MSTSPHVLRQRMQSYRSPIEREGCRTCRHRSADVLRLDGGRLAYDCTLGRFLVAPGGICDHHQPAGIAGLPRTNPTTPRS